ncbi:MAG: rhodanese-like domain-containing protein [Anaerolineales bacterium]
MTKRKSVSLKRQSRRPLSSWGLLLLGGVLLIVAAVWLFGRSGQENLPTEISVQEAYQAYQQGAFVLDVRTQPEWDEYHVEGTTLIPLDELPNRLSELPRGEKIVVVCRSGNRSGVATQILRENGFQATSMAGGLNAWRTAGYPVIP